MRSRRFVLLAVAAGLLSLVAMGRALAAPPNPIWVSTTGNDATGDGTVVKPYRTIAKGLSMALVGWTVECFGGTYDETVTLKSGVVLMGAGSNSTTIQGTGGGPVVQGSGVSACTVRGFAITGGSGVSGGGVRLFQSAVVVSDNRIVDNNASAGGGGIYADQCATGTIKNNVISNNTASWGGGIGWTEGGTPVIASNTISNNSASEAGGIFMGGAAGTITANLITSNTAHGWGFYYGGGGIKIQHSSSRVEKNRITGNYGFYGGGLRAENDQYFIGAWADPTIVDNTITANRAQGGGGIWAANASAPVIRRNTIAGNKAGSQGGGGLTIGEDSGVGPLYLGDCDIRDNETSIGAMGGGIRVQTIASGWEPYIRNCTIYGNSASAGGGIYVNGGLPSALANSVLWGNGDDLDGAITPLNCDIEDGDGAGSNGNISLNPMFVDETARDLRLSPRSPCVDTGHTPYAAGDDRLGATRIVDGDNDTVANVDMGAYELQGYGGARTLCVATTGSDTIGIGTSPKPFRSIGFGFARALAGDTVQAAAGTYAENVALKSGVPLKGAGASSTIIDGGGTASVVSASHVTGGRIEGFTLRNGFGAGGYGGGVYSDSSSIAVTDCVVRECTAPIGGGIYLCFSNGSSITGNLLLGNRASNSGGGMHVEQSPGTLVARNTLLDNVARQRAGGMNVQSVDTTVTDNVIAGNSVEDTTSPSFMGGGVILGNTDVWFVNNTVASNVARYGAGVSSGVGSYVVTDCVVWGNSTEDLRNVTPMYSDYGTRYLGPAGVGNLSVDPKFEDEAARDYRLAGRSPCIDAGTDAGASATDRNGVARPQDGDLDGSAVADMGAYEYVFAPTTIHVAVMGSDTTGTGHATRPFRTIGRGMADALGQDTVAVGAGRYTEDVTLTSGVSLGGAGAFETTIQGTGTRPVVFGDHVNASTAVRNLTVTGGAAPASGGGICLWYGDARLENLVIVGNRADLGGGIGMLYSSPTISNCTIVSNAATTGGSGVYNSNSTPNARNCIVWDNVGPSPVFGAGLTYSDVQGGSPPATCISADPFFQDAAAGDYRLAIGSPCIDAGTNTGAPAADAEGIPRPQDGDADGTYVADMGAHERPYMVVAGGVERVTKIGTSIASLFGSAVQMRWMEVGPDVWTSSPFEEKIPCTLSGAEGTKTIVVEYLCDNGHTYSFSDTVYLDVTLPVVVSLTSSTHPDPAAWYPEPTATLAWSGEDSSGVTGYSYVLDTAPTTVPDSKSEGTPTTITTATPANGAWYFHIKALDAVGRWGSAVHRAVLVDTTPPSGLGVTSTSHSAGVVSADRTVDAVLANTTDTPSGVAGYSVLWDHAATSVPPTMVALGAAQTALTSDALTDGTWYLHACAIDRAGNRSAVAHFGPLAIDGPPAALSGFAATAGESSATLSWTAPAEPDAAAVRVLRSSSAHAASPTDGAGQAIAYEGAASGPTRFLDTGLVNGVTYRYTGFVRDVAGNWSPAAAATALPAMRPRTSVAFRFPGGRVPAPVIACGGTAKLDVVLETTPGGQRVPNPLVRLIVVPAAPITGTPSTTVTGGPLGECRALVTLWCSARARWEYAGDGTYASARSATFTVGVRSYLGRPRTPSTVRRRRLFTISGDLKPRHSGKTRIYVYGRVGRRWRAVARVWAKNRAYRSWTSYSVRTKIAKAGRYAVRAYHRDADHAAGYSAWRYFRVR